MSKIFEAVIDEQGKLIVPDDIKLPAGQRVQVMISGIYDVSIQSEYYLEDWNRPQEDAAWSHLQKVQ